MGLRLVRRSVAAAAILGLLAGCRGDRSSDDAPARDDAAGKAGASTASFGGSKAGASGTAADHNAEEGSSASSSSAASFGGNTAGTSGTTADHNAEEDSSRGGSGDFSGTTTDPVRATGGGPAMGGAPSGPQVAAGAPATGGQPSAGGDTSGVLDIPEIAPPPGILTTHKVDLLFVIDNSASMQDKQIMFAQAATDMLAVLVNPPCVDESGAIVDQPTTPEAACSTGTRRIPPVRDLHAGVITSSLGGHGNPDFCEGGVGLNDSGHLVATVRTIEVPDGGYGFVAWGEDTTEGGPPRLQAFDELSRSVVTMIHSAGEDGCGYEAQLEAWYRFLVDPVPPATVIRDGDVTVREGIDTALLEQRKAFLRPDSALVVVVLSDENDCSIKESGYGWLAGKTTLNVGTSACAEDPNDPCCTYCGFNAAPEGCPPLTEDPACTGSDNFRNVRCWDQKRRFGIDFRYPVTRYLAGLRDGVVCPDSSTIDGDCGCRLATALGKECEPGSPVTNPLYTDLTGTGAPVRDRSLVFLLSVGGVPWQDLATDETLESETELAYKTGSAIDWDLILGDAAAGVPPLDTLMVESTEPRTGPPHPLTGVAPQPPESSSPHANPINGHEWLPQNNEDLQYACIFALDPLLQGSTRDCNVLAQQTCDCFDATFELEQVNMRMKPLCQAETGEYGPFQHYAKAYPSLRQLELVRMLGRVGFAASICPKILEPTSPFFGYKPAVHPLLPSLLRVIE